MALTASIDASFTARAATQHGAIARWQLRELGIDRRVIARREAAGLLVEVLPDVFLVGPVAARPTPEALCMAGVLHGGDRSAASHQTAARLLDVWNRGPDDVDVLSTRHQHGKPIDGLRLHRTRHLDSADIVIVDGIPVTSGIRTCLDLGSALRPVQLTNVIFEAVFRGVVDVDELDRAVAARGCVPGSGVVREAIGRYRAGSAGTRSRSEDRLHERIERDWLPLPIVNTPGAAGVPALECDMVWTEPPLVLEVDGRGHVRPGTRAADRGRNAWLHDVDMPTWRVPAWRCWHDLDNVMAELRWRLGLA